MVRARDARAGVALPLTFSRSAEVGVCAGVALLFLLKDRRLLAMLPVIAALSSSPWRPRASPIVSNRSSTPRSDRSSIVS